MKKIIFVDGSQGAGKSTLISGISSRTPVYIHKFPFSEYTKTFSLNSNESLKGFQLGKDLATLYFMSRTGWPRPWSQIVDRGPFSTAYYSLTTGRMTEGEVEEFIKNIAEFSEPFSFIFVVAKNQVDYVRDKKDGFDNLKRSEVNPVSALETIERLADKYRVGLKVFYNDFSVGISQNVDKFYQLVKEEL